MTPEETAQLQSLRQEFAPQSVPGFWSQLGQGLSNTLGTIESIPLGAGLAAARGIGALTGQDTSGMYLKPEDTPYRFFNPPPPTTGAQMIGSVAGQLPGQIAALAGPQTEVSAGAKLLGAGPMLSGLAGNVAAGVLSGAPTGQSAQQGAEFGAMSGVQALANALPGPAPVKTIFRTIGNAAIPLASSAIRGQDPFTEQNLVQAGVQGILGSGAPEALLSRLNGADAASVPPNPADEPPSETQPSGPLALTWPHGDARSYSPSGDPIIIDPTLGQQGQLALPGPLTTPSARPWQMLQWPYGGGQGIPLPEGEVTPERQAYRDLLRKAEPPTIDVQAETQPLIGQSNIGAAVEKNVNDLLMLSGGDHERAAQMADSYGMANVAQELRNRALPSAVEPTPLIGQGPEPVAAAERTPAEAASVPAMPEIQGGDIPQIPQMQYEPSGGRITSLMQQWKLESDPVKKTALWNQMQELEARNPPGFKLGQSNESGNLPIPLLTTLAGGSAGALYGYATGDTPDERLNRALGFGALGAAAGGLAPNATKFLRMATPAGRQQIVAEVKNRIEPQPGVEDTVTGRAGRWMQQNLPSVSPEVYRALEKARGKSNYVRGMVDDAAPAFMAIKDSLTPADKAVGAMFLNSAGKPADISALDSSAAPQAYKDFLKATQAAKIEGQRTVLSGEGDLKKRVLIASTMGTWNTRQFRAISDPDFKIDPVAFQKVVDEWSNTPEFRNSDPSQVRQAVSQHIGELRGDSPQYGERADPRISGTLYMRKKDLRPNDWQFLQQLSTKPGLTPDVQKFLGDMAGSRSVDMGDQAFLKTLAQNRKFVTPDEADTLREIANREILTPAHRQLLGEITDPLERQILSVNKLANSVRAGEALNQLGKAVFPDGRQMAYDRQGHANALQEAQLNGNADKLKALQNYVQLPDSAGLGKLAGKYVPLDASDALKAMFDSSNLPTPVQAVKIGNSWIKEMLTVANPASQAHHYFQVPFFAAAARIGPTELPGLMKDYLAVMRTPGSALRKEMIQNHVNHANFSDNDLLSMQRQLAGANAPSLFSRLRGAARKSYGLPDDLVRGAAYLKHKDAFLTEAAANGLMGDAANEYAVNKTMDLLRRYTRNYSALPPFINAAKHIPVISPFVSHTYEMTRIGKNLLQDLATGDGKTRVYAAAALAALYGGQSALSVLSKHVFLNDKDRKDYEAIQELMPSNQRWQAKLVTGREKDGTFKIVGLNSWFPHAEFASLIDRALHGDLEAIANENQAFGFHKSPLVSAAMDIGEGQNYYTHQPIDEPWKVADRALEAVVPPWAPPSGFQFKRLLRGVQPNDQGGMGTTNLRTGARDSVPNALLSMAGANISYAKPEGLLMRLHGDASQKVDDAKQEAKRVLQSTASDKAKAEAIRVLRVKTTKIADELEQKRALLAPAMK